MQTLKQERDAEMAALQERITHLQAQEQVGRSAPPLSAHFLEYADSRLASLIPSF